MKVLHILNELKASGAEMMLVSASETFRIGGVTGDILSTGDKIGAFAPELIAAGYKLHQIPFKKSFRFFSDVYHLMKNNYDVVHIHTERANFWLGLVALAVNCKLVVRTIHSNFEFRGNLRLRRSLQRRFLARLGVKHIAIGESVQRNERINFGLTTKIIPNWFDSNRFGFTSDVDRNNARRSLNIPHNERVVVSVGNCSPVKNHSAILECLALIKPEKCPLYLHVGMEESGYPEQIQAKKLGIESRVKFIGSLSDIRPVLRAADIFIMTSNYEGFGIAAIEAMAVGLPVILTDVIGLSDFKNISPCVTHTANDPKAISLVLCNALDSSKELSRLYGEELSLNIVSRYGLEVGPKEYCSLYKRRI